MKKKSELVAAAREKRRQEAENLKQKYAQDVCGNAALRVELTSEEPGKFEFNYSLINDGCTNQRRYNSRYCQECSNHHNGV